MATSLSTAQLDWTAQDWTVAATILGEQAAFLMRLIKTSAALGNEPRESDYTRGYRAGCQGEAERMAIDLARRAANAAFMAEREYEKVALFLNPVAAEVYETLGQRDPRD